MKFFYVLIQILFLILSPALQAEEETKGVVFPLERQEDTPSAIERQLKGERGFMSEFVGNTNGCGSCGT